MTLFCIPFAGGGCHAYRPLQAHLPAGVELCTLELPGRGKRFREELLTDIEAMVGDVGTQVEAGRRGHYAVFGHSLGAVLAYLVSHRIVAAGQPPPLHLFISGSEPPWCPAHREPVAGLPDDEFLSRVAELGGLPEEVAATEELMELFLPVLRADFAAAEAYQSGPLAPLDVPVSVLCGSDDEQTCDQVMQWQAMASRPIAVHRLTGGHFYLFDHAQAVGRILASAIHRSLATTEVLSPAVVDHDLPSDQ